MRVSYKRMLMHDLSKFQPCEFFAYASHFHGKNRDLKNDPAWAAALKHHFENNDHHPEFFIKYAVLDARSGVLSV